MADHRQLLYELLKENQEPFHLKSYIAERRFQLKKPPLETTLQLRNRDPVKSSACFLSFQNSPDVRKSPIKDPRKCPGGGGGGPACLRVPSRTAAMLVESAIRIQKQQQSKPKSLFIKHAGFRLFGSFLKKLGKNKKRAIGNSDFNVSTINKGKMRGKVEENEGISCSCNGRYDLEASTSTCRFSVNKRPFCSGSAGGQTPHFSSPEDSRVKKGNEYDSKNPKKVESKEQEEEQCSPVSVLDAPFEEDGHRSGDDGDYNLECSYANVQMAKEQLLEKLRRFEKLAGLDPMELERKMLQSSDDEFEHETMEESDVGDEPLPLGDDTFETEMSDNMSFRDHTRKMSNDVELALDLVVEGKGKVIFSSGKEFIFGRICTRMNSWNEVKFDTIDNMVDMDFKYDFDGWKGFPEHMENTVAEMELEIFEILVEELSSELFSMEECCQGMNNVECS